MKDTKKLIHYRLAISQFFPSYHSQAGKPTCFPSRILFALVDYDIQFNHLIQKIHTCRENYDLWEKRFKKIDEGLAVLELFPWQGKPYRSCQHVFATLDSTNGIGLQKLTFNTGMKGVSIEIGENMETLVSIDHIAQNDGLSTSDYLEWFKNTDLSTPKALIHFTAFRYD